MQRMIMWLTTSTLIMLNPVHASETTVSLGADYSSGKYGGSESTEILYIPMILKYETGPWIGKLTIPYIRITGPGDVVPDLGRVGTFTRTRQTEQGLGDITASLTRAVYSDQRVLLDATGKIKFATADEDKFLGTGENDYAAHLDAYFLHGRLTPLATLGYKVLGDPPGRKLDNVIYASAGFTYKVDPKISAGMIYDYRERSTPTNTARRELMVFATHKLQPDWSLQTYAVRGFSDDSADWGVGVIVGHAYR